MSNPDLHGRTGLVRIEYPFERAPCRGAASAPAIVQEAPRLPATLSLVAAGLGVSLVPASMRHLAAVGIAFRALADHPRLSAPVHLVLRRTGATATAARSGAAVKALAAEHAVRVGS